jgi:hypothetical protein
MTRSRRAHIQYAAQCTDSGLPVALANLGPGSGDCTGATISDEVLTTGVKGGYNSTYTPGAPDDAGITSTYSILALPVSVSVTGPRVLLDAGRRYSLQRPRHGCDPSVNGGQSPVRVEPSFRLSYQSEFLGDRFADFTGGRLTT